MIYKKHINRLGFTTLEEVFQYIIDSKTNGQFSQAKYMIDMMSTDQHTGFILWLRTQDVKIEPIYMRRK